MTAGELSEQFPVSKPTMSAHFAVLQEAGLIESEKSGRTITYRLVMSVLEEGLLGFVQAFGWDLVSGATNHAPGVKVTGTHLKGGT